MNTSDQLVQARWLDAADYEAAHISNVRVDNSSAPAEAQPESLPALIQLVGYLKQLGGAKLYLRGQCKLYGTAMSPTLLRTFQNSEKGGDILGKLITSLASWQCSHEDHSVVDCPELTPPNRKGAWAVAQGTPRYSIEPLLQHYGIRTRWIDVVDNLWVALWFACHRFERFGRYMHPVRLTLNEASPRVYVIAALIPEPLAEVQKGLWRGNAGRIIDLRVAAPSFYVRPHAQHGLLIRPRNEDQGQFRYAAISVSLHNALSWLGDSVLLSPYGLFPPLTEDYGHRSLLEGFEGFDVPRSLGAIDVVGPGY